MRYKINKHAILRKMAEYGQTIEQKIAYLQYNLSVEMEKKHFLLFNSLAHGYNIYYMLLNEAFGLLRLNYNDYFIIVQSTEHEYIIEIRKK